MGDEWVKEIKAVDPQCGSGCYVEMLFFRFVGDGITCFLHILAYSGHGVAGTEG